MDLEIDGMAKRKPPTPIDIKICGIITCLISAIGRIPRPVARRLGNGLGNLGFRLDRRHRKVALDNLSLAFGDELTARQRWALVRSVYHHLGQILFEVGWSMRASDAELDRSIHIEGLEHYHAAFEKGKGVLVVTGHLGNWELLSIVADHARIPIHVVYRPMDFTPLNLFFEWLRSRFGARLIPTSHAMIRIVRALKKKEVVAILMDQSVDWYDGVWVDFFGHRTCTSKGMALIALKSRSPVLSCFLYREKTGFRAVFGPEIPLVDTGDKTKDIEANSLNYSKSVEQGIRRHPEQWFWVHRRWKKKAFCEWPRK
jgi:KDO2-lipid IV(A) lauroyltransferase